MKKKIITVAIALAALVGLPAVAQNPSDNNSSNQNTEQTCKRGDKARKDKDGKDAKKAKGDKDAKRGKDGQGRQQQQRQQRDFTAAFEGIVLTPEQQTAIQALKPQRPDRSQNSDSVARPDRNKMRSDYVAGVKKVLTPDQYVVFLENVVVNNAPIPGAGQKSMRHEAMMKNKKDLKERVSADRGSKDSKAAGKRADKSRKDVKNMQNRANNVAKQNNVK